MKRATVKVPIKVYRCTVIRKQRWTFDVEARDAEEAKDKADSMAFDPPDDDWSYETTAEELR